MEFKYPKKILVGDVEFKIIYDYKSGAGAEFCYPDNIEKAFVKFGMMNIKQNPLSFLNMVIHEFKEILQVEQGARLFNRAEDNYVFHYNHSQHGDMCCRLAGILNEFIK